MEFVCAHFGNLLGTTLELIPFVKKKQFIGICHNISYNYMRIEHTEVSPVPHYLKMRVPSTQEMAGDMLITEQFKHVKGVTLFLNVRIRSAGEQTASKCTQVTAIKKICSAVSE
jgi:hypothetical protein